MKRKAIILFTRIPLAGKVKTRMQPFLSDEECSILQEAFIKDIFGVLKKVCADIVICYTPEGHLSRLKFIIGEAAAYIPQKGEKLGDKMYNAIYDTLSLGYGCCILIGSDIPLLKKDDIETAFEILNNKDLVISPTEDGGYYLIGMKKPLSTIFHLEYGGSTVFEKTLTAINNAGKIYGIGPTVPDIDDKYDLQRLADILEESAPEQCLHTRKALQLIFGRGGKHEGFKNRSNS